MSENASRDVRVLCYDVDGLRGDRDAMDAMVRGLAPDLVIVQGAPRRWRWRTRCADLADRFRLQYTGGGQPSLGNLVLVSMRVSVREVRYPHYPLIAGRLFRGAMLAACEIAGRRLVVAGSQLSTEAGERLDQAAVLAAALSDVDKDSPAGDGSGTPAPVILGLDLNEDLSGPAARLLADGRTVAGSAGRASILVDSRIEVRGCRVVDTPEARRAGRHLPMVADLRLPVTAERLGGEVPMVSG